jgi:hypothetical protein
MMVSAKSVRYSPGQKNSNTVATSGPTIQISSEGIGPICPEPKMLLYV